MFPIRSVEFSIWVSISRYIACLSDLQGDELLFKCHLKASLGISVTVLSVRTKAQLTQL